MTLQPVRRNRGPLVLTIDEMKMLADLAFDFEDENDLTDDEKKLRWKLNKIIEIREKARIQRGTYATSSAYKAAGG